MKTTLVVLFVFCAAVAFGQVGASINSYSQPIQMSGTPQHAIQHEMAEQHSLVGGMNGTYTVASGERPLWEFGPVSEPVPLGDVARAFRKEKLAVKKAEIVFEKQGS